MAFSLRDVWEQSDWWDKEENAKQKQAAQTRRSTVQKQPAKTVTKPKQTVWDKTRDVFDANSSMDIYKRTQRGVPSLYQDAERLKGVGERSINTNPLERAVTFGRATVDGITEAPRALGRAVGNTAATFSTDYKNAQESEKRLRDIEQQTDRTMFKLYNSGTPEQRQRAANYLNKSTPAQTGMNDLNAKIAFENDPRRLAAAGGSLALDLATLGTASATKGAIQGAYRGARATGKGVTTGLVAGGKQFATDTAKTAAMGAGSGFASTYVNDPNATVNQALKGAGTGAAFGAALPAGFVGASTAAPVIAKATTKLVSKVPDVVQSFDDKLVSAANPVYGALLDARKTAQRAFDVETNPRSREQINRYIAELDQEIGKSKRGGINGEPMKMPVDPTKGAPIEKTYYHGTQAPIKGINELDEMSGRMESLFGPGIYLTDNKNIAIGYAGSRGANATAGKVLEGKIGDAKLYNLEDTLPKDVADIFQKKANSLVDYPEDLPDFSKLKGVDAIRELKKYLPDSETYDDFFTQELHPYMKSKGYDGFSHIGGVQGGEKHNVAILFDNKKLSSTPVSAPIEKTAPKIDPEMQQVIDAANKAIADGDYETAKLLGESLPKEQATIIAKTVQTEIDKIEAEALNSVTTALRKEAMQSGDGNANASLLQIADKIAKHFNAPKSLYKITGFERTYNTPSGTLKVGGNAKSALDNVFLNGDITTFTKNVNILADKFGGTFREIADSIKGTGKIDEADYNILTKELYERFSKRPSYRAAESNISRGNSAAVQGGSTRNTSTAQSSIADVANPQTTVRQPRVVPQVNEQTAITKPSVGAVKPPKKPPVDNPSPQLGAGKQKQTKYASKTIPTSEYVSDPIKGQTKKNAPLYTPENEKLRYNKALTELKSKGDAKFENDLMEALNGKKGSISGQDVANAQAYAAKLDVDGNYAKASEIYDKISEHLTAAGQTIQAAAIMSRRSPEGLRRHALQVWKKAGVKVTPEVEKELATLTQKVKSATTQEAKTKAAYSVSEFVKKQVPDNIWNKSVNIWRAGLLTSPVTTAGNLLANTGETAIRKGFVNPVATAADAVMGAFTGKRTTTLANAGSASKGFKEGAGTLPEYFRTGYQPGDVNLKAKYENSGTINYGNGALGKGLGAYVNGVYRLMGVADAPYRQAATREALSSMANAEALNKGLKGQAKKQFVQEYLANPPQSAVQRAADEGTRATFQNDTLLNDIASGVKQKLEKKSPGAKALSDFVMPFVRTPSAIATRLIERTPIGIGKEIATQIVNVKSGKPFDQRAMAQSIGNGSFGAVAIGAGMALANADLMTYGYPTDEKERKLWDSEGKQPYSVKVGDRWYSLNYLQPFGSLLAIGGQAKKDMDDGLSGGEASAKALATAAQSIQEQSFLKGISGVLDMISDPERSARKYMEQTFSSITPNFVRAAARAADPVQRKATSIPESVALGIPGLRDNVPTKNDMFGNPLPAKDNFLNQYVNPLRPSKVRGDDTTAELRRLFESDNGVMPSEANANVFGKDTRLDKKQLIELNKYTGQAMQPVYDEVIKSEQYKALSDEDKVKVLKKVNDVVYGAEKIAWGVKNNVIEADGKKLTKDQIAYLQGQGVDFFPKEKTTATKTAKTSKKKSGRKSGGSRKRKDFRTDLFAFNPVTFNKSLRSIVEDAISW